MSAYIFDTETTDREDGQIIEAAWLRFAPMADLAGLDSNSIPTELTTPDAKFVQRYRPTKLMTFGAMATHHIFPSDLTDCPPTESFRLPEDTGYLIGHNVDFDWKAARCPANIKRICTDAISRHTWQEADAYSLSALVYMLEGVSARPKVKNAHGAMVDCELVAILLHHILREHSTINTWEQLWQLSEKCRIPLVMPFGKHKGTPLGELDYSYISWCLNQDWITEYLRQGLNNVLRDREGEFA